MEIYNCLKCNTKFEKGTKFCQGCGCNLESEFIEQSVCSKCNKTFYDGSIFCDVDGAELILPQEIMPKCVMCGTEYSDGTKFCPKDGGEVVSEVSRLGVNRRNVSSQMNSEGVYFKASLGSRFLASFLDALISLALSVPAIVLYVIGLTKVNHYSSGQGAILMFALAAFLYLIPLTYSFIKDGLGRGQSFGKRAAGIMVVYLPNNTPCSFGQSFLRALIMALISFVPFGSLVEPIMVLATEDGIRLGDKAAKTQVIEVNDYNSKN